MFNKKNKKKTMKKLYMKPVLQVTVIEFASLMLVASTPNAVINVEGSVNADEIESRSSYSAWGDDDD